MADARCHGAGEVTVGTRQDSFGNWDTEESACPGCPDCRLTESDRLLLAHGEAAAHRYGWSEQYRWAVEKQSLLSGDE